MKIAFLTISQDDLNETVYVYATSELAKQAVRKALFEAITLGHAPVAADYDELEQTLAEAKTTKRSWYLNEVAGGSYEIVEREVKEICDLQMTFAMLTIIHDDSDQTTRIYKSTELAKQAVRQRILKLITFGHKPEKEDYDELEQIMEQAHDDTDCWHLDEVDGGSYEIVEMTVRNAV